VWITKDGGALGRSAVKECAPSTCLRDAVRTGRPGPHLSQCVRESRRLVGAASQRHLQVDDAAGSWSEIKDVQPSVFGFPVVVHPKEPETAWFIPAVKDEKRYPRDGRVVVTRTKDGGKSFRTLTKGLPQVHAYDLVFRHAMDIDQTGEQLAFGSTTDQCGSAKMAAIPGQRCRRICLRCTRCVSSRNRIMEGHE